MWSNRNSHSLLVKMQNGTDTLGQTLGWFLTKLNILLPYEYVYTLWYLPRGVENLCPYKNWHMNLYSSLIPNCQNLEATKMSLSRWMNKQTVEHLYNGIPLGAKRNALSSYKKTWKKLKCILPSERRWPEKATYCMNSTIWHVGKDKTILKLFYSKIKLDRVKRSVVARG